MVKNKGAQRREPSGEKGGVVDLCLVAGEGLEMVEKFVLAHIWS